MAYTIVKSDGTVLTTIPDGTINTSSTSLGLPGRNYAGYGQAMDTNFVHQIENFAANTPPANPIRGQLWYNTNDSTLYVCPTDGESNALAWLSLTSTSSGGTTSFGNVSVIGDLSANNITVTNNSNANAFSGAYLTISANADIANANINSANANSLTTTFITSGSPTTDGTLEGVWTVNGGPGGAGSTAMYFNNGGIAISNASGNIYGIKCDNYMYANGTPISFAGTYSNANVAGYLPVYSGNILTVTTTAVNLTTGANTTAGTLTGTWTLSPGSSINGLSNIAGANVTGTVANAAYATTAGTVTVSAQPNVTSVGTLSSLAVNGGVVAKTLTSNIATGTAPLSVQSTTKVANLNADLLDGYQANVSNTVSTVAVRDSNGNLSATYFIGNGAFLTGVSTSSTVSNIANGSSNVNIPASGGNVTISIGGIANVVAVGTTSVAVNGTLTATSFAGAGTGLTAIPGPNVTGPVPNAVYAVTAGTAVSVPAANVSGTVALASHATVADTANSVAGANVTGTVPSATSASTAGVAYSVSGSNVSGTVAAATRATVADSANSVAGANVSGAVASATYATSAGSASTATSATNASHATTADTVSSISGAQVTSALGFTPYNASNPAGYISGVSLSGTGGITVSGGGSSYTLGASGPILHNITPGYTSGGNVSVGTSAPSAPTQGDFWFDTSGGTGYNQSLSANGWTQLPNGLIMQWGSAAAPGNGTSGAYTFPTAFTSTCFQIYGTTSSPNAGAVDGNKVGAMVDQTSPKTQFKVYSDDGGVVVQWFALGI